MCYLVANDVNKLGCYALKTKHGPGLIQFKKELTNIVGFDKIQFVTISRPSAYGEYEPYTFVETEDEMKKAVMEMI